MKILKTTILSLLILGVILYFSGFIFVKHKGNEILVEALQKTFKREVIVDKLRYSFPFGIHAEAVHIKPDLYAGNVEMQSTVESIFSKEKKVTHLLISDGTWRWKSKQEEFPLTLRIENISLRISNIDFPLKAINTEYEISGNIIECNLPILIGGFQSAGWFNFVDKNMDGQFFFSEVNSLLEITAHLKSQRNQLNVDGQIELERIPQEMEINDFNHSFQKLIVKIFKSTNAELKTNFSFNTPMDSFAIEKISFDGSVSSDMLENLESQQK